MVSRRAPPSEATCNGDEHHDAPSALPSPCDFHSVSGKFVLQIGECISGFFGTKIHLCGCQQTGQQQPTATKRAHENASSHRLSWAGVILHRPAAEARSLPSYEPCTPPPTIAQAQRTTAALRGRRFGTGGGDHLRRNLHYTVATGSSEGPAHLPEIIALQSCKCTRCAPTAGPASLAPLFGILKRK